MPIPSAARYGLLTLVVVAIGGAVAWRVAAQRTPLPTAVVDHSRDAIACLGRILPQDGIFRLSARSLSGQPSLVAEVLVKEGEAVTRGQLVAVLNSRDQLEAAWRTAEARIRVSRSRLDQVKAGAKPADLQAQRAEIARLEIELANANREQRRYQDLHQQRVVSTAELDTSRMRADSVTQLLAQAKERLSSLGEIRDVDLAFAEADLQAVITAANQARTEFEQTQIRAPVDGRVIRIVTWPGEEVKAAGIMEVGKTDKMYVVAEVDEGDVRRLKVGQRATVSGGALSAPLSGVVEYVALTVAKNDQRNLDPIAPSDARVIQTKIRLDDSTTAARFINAQVTVLIAR